MLFASVVLRGRDGISRFKLFDDPEQPSFCDLDADPGEETNLLERLGRHRDQMRELRESPRSAPRICRHSANSATSTEPLGQSSGASG